jgi:TetR/AcrR family transcriptional regulator, fatty acid metabolism regulator protein
MALSSDKRTRILNAAVSVFADRGFFQSRVSDVADAAGVAGGTIYLYFKSKDDLLISLFEDRMDSIISHVNDALSSVDTASARLKIFVQKHLMMVEQHPELAEVLIVELRQSAKFMREYTPIKFAEYLDIIEQIVRDGVSAGEFRIGLNPRLAKRIIFGALEEVSATWLRFRRDGVVSPFELEQAGTQIWEMLSAGFFQKEHHAYERSIQ